MPGAAECDCVVREFSAQHTQRMQRLRQLALLLDAPNSDATTAQRCGDSDDTTTYCNAVDRCALRCLQRPIRVVGDQPVQRNEGSRGGLVKEGKKNERRSVICECKQK